ncbi:MAG: hypothetical protein HFJ40_00140 [Clostridia bacterium]|nr:hypothetical protein [Clostridia bacterium]
MSLPTCTVSTNNIQNLPDAPNLSSDELKHEFDKSGKDFKDYINEILLPAVERLVKDEKANLEVSINNKILEDNKRKYHIGKIIMSTSDTNPNEYLGFGTWVLWGSGKVPVGVDSADTDFDTAEKTGGEKTHTLTIAEMPKHSHQMNCIALASNPGPISTPSIATPTYQAPTSETGEGKPHNNLQPYITCYMWKRTA